MLKIPHHWMRASRQVVLPDGRTRELTVWGWSDSSRGEAAAHAERRLAELAVKVQRGEDLTRGYAYGSRPLREQILQVLDGRAREPDAILTRNAYGSIVVNAAHTLFVDVDLPSSDGLAGWLRSLLGRPDPVEAGARARLQQRLQQVPGGSFRIYRTAAGFRVMATDPPFNAGSLESEQLMRDVGADPAFVQLCRAQQSFRARLTPKPWRCGHAAPPSEFPREHPDAIQGFEAWLAAYDRACAPYATCRFLETIGWGRVHPDNAEVLRLHDAYTRADTDLKLA